MLYQCPTSRAIIWPEHRCGLRPREVRIHLRKEHPDLSPTARRNVLSYLELVPFIRPTEPIAPLPHLRRWSNGLLGSEPGCGFICTHLHSIRLHCTTRHGWVNPRRRGQHAPFTREWKQGVACQKLYPTGTTDNGYFQILMEPHFQFEPQSQPQPQSQPHTREVTSLPSTPTPSCARIVEPQEPTEPSPDPTPNLSPSPTPIPSPSPFPPSSPDPSSSLARVRSYWKYVRSMVVSKGGVS